MMKLNKIVFVLAASLSFSSLPSCEMNSPFSSKAPSATPSVSKEKQSVSESAKGVGEVSNAVAKGADDIDKHASAIENKTPEAAKASVQPEVDGIRDGTKGLRENSASLKAIEQKLKDAEASLAGQQKSIEEYIKFAKESEIQKVKLEDKIKDLETSNAKLLKTMLAWITVCCVIGIGVSVLVGFVFKTPAAFLVAAGCLATMGISIAVTIYLQQIAWIALAALGVGFVAAVVYVFTQIKHKDSAVKERDVAVKELVHTGEIAKTYLPDAVREKIFGNSVEPGIAHQIQSDTTIKLVSDVRSADKTKRGYGLAPTVSK